MTEAHPPSTADVAVLGGGPAASIAAATLAEAGARVLVAEPPLPSSPVGHEGQCLPPAGYTWLRALGLDDDFLKGRHRRIVAHRSLWSSEAIDSTDLISSPQGGAWQIDRAHFDALLRGAARARGARFVSGALLGITRHEDRWSLDLRTDGSRGRTVVPFVIDGTGRKSTLLRARGVRVAREDQLIAFTRIAESTERRDRDDTTLVEAVEAGWWYTTRIDAARRIFVFFTDADLRPDEPRSPAMRFEAALSTSDVTSKILHEHGYRFVAPTQAAPANGARAARLGGTGWLATGDAACRHDPLCGHGLIAAMDSGRRAAAATIAAAGGKTEALEEYEQATLERWEAYRVDLADMYAQQPRWPAAAFWARRRFGAKRLERPRVAG